MSNPVANAILQKFEKALVATTSLRSGLESLKYDVRRVTAGSILVREGSFPQSTMLVLEGCIFRHKITGDGRRQIFSFQIAGDFADLQSTLCRVVTGGGTQHQSGWPEMKRYYCVEVTRTVTCRRTIIVCGEDKGAAHEVPLRTPSPRLLERRGSVRAPASRPIRPQTLIGPDMLT